MQARDFSRTFSEIVLCSNTPPNAFRRELGVRGQTVTLFHVMGLTPWMSLDDVFEINKDIIRRVYRGPVEIAKRFDYHCPYCRNSLVYECLNCGLLWCSPAEKMEHRCDWCKASGPVVFVPTGPLLAPEPYEPPPLRKRLWWAWLDFNEWVYEWMTRKGRPEAIHQAAAPFRKPKKP
jgi:hypothetical protein